MDYMWWLLLLCAGTGYAESPSPVHCADEKGRIIGLTADSTYHVKLPIDGPPGGTNPEKWTRQQEVTASAPASNSFTGSYMQVLPDDRDTYNEITGYGSFTMTGLEYNLRIFNPGQHTLFLRWTGGDTVGGGDSLYVVMYDAQTGAVVPGMTTYTPQVEPITEVPGKFAGCCYDPQTHACPCYKTEEVGNVSTGPAGCHAFWASLDQLSRRFGRRGHARMCETGHGVLDIVEAPTWYLFAGQACGNAMDFDCEPWDATCEAEGKGTKDTGLDFAQWNLQPGDYRIVFYPREDGVAIDAFYLTTPRNNNPPNGLVLNLGDSTTAGCGEAPPTDVQRFPQALPQSVPSPACGWSTWEVLFTIVFVAQSVGILVFWVFLRRSGRSLQTILKPASSSAEARSAAPNAALYDASRPPSHYVPPVRVSDPP